MPIKQCLWCWWNGWNASSNETGRNSFNSLRHVILPTAFWILYLERSSFISIHTHICILVNSPYYINHLSNNLPWSQSLQPQFCDNNIIFVTPLIISFENNSWPPQAIQSQLHMTCALDTTPKYMFQLIIPILWKFLHYNFYLKQSDNVTFLPVVTFAKLWADLIIMFHARVTFMVTWLRLWPH